MSNKDAKFSKAIDANTSIPKPILEVEFMSTSDNKESKTELKVESTKAELSYAQKKDQRRNAIDKKSRLFIDEKYKEPGYKYRFCNITPGNIESYLDKGYEVVTHQMNSGSGNIARPEIDGNPGEIEVGGATGKQKAILMRIGGENLQMLNEIEQENADAQQALLYRGKTKDGNPFIPDSMHAKQYGKITKDYL